jgi:protein PhnA
MNAAIDSELMLRAEQSCELCRGTEGLRATLVQPKTLETAANSILVCRSCQTQIPAQAELDVHHLYCLNEAAWSQIPAIQVTSWRLLQRLSEQAWASELLEQLYLDEDTLAWAQEGCEQPQPVQTMHVVDCNGTPLVQGDSVTVIKDLDVKGTSFVAKRGTTVKNIRITDDPDHVEGRVNKVAIMLKTCFLKRINS